MDTQSQNKMRKNRAITAKGYGSSFLFYPRGRIKGTATSVNFLLHPLTKRIINSIEIALLNFFSLVDQL